MLKGVMPWFFDRKLEYVENMHVYIFMASLLALSISAPSIIAFLFSVMNWLLVR